MNYREELSKRRNTLRQQYAQLRTAINHPKLRNVIRWENGRAVITHHYAVTQMIPVLRVITKLQSEMRDQAVMLLELENAIEHMEGRQ